MQSWRRECATEEELKVGSKDWDWEDVYLSTNRGTDVQ